jgi:hypothetical protein
MKRASVAIPLLLILAGCLSPPLPQDVVEVRPPPSREPLLTQEVVKLSQAGVSDEVIVGLIRSRGVSNRPGLADIRRLEEQGVSSNVRLFLLASPFGALPPRAEPKFVVREFFIPLWPSYAGGRWRIGLRLECLTRTPEEQPPTVRPPEPRPSLPQPDRLDP